VIHLRITPDSRLSNDNVEQLAQTLCIYSSPFERLNGLRIGKSNFVSSEWRLQKGKTSFVITVLENMETVARKAIETSFPKASVEVVADPLINKPTLITELSLQYHYFLALKVDRREITHISSILDTLSLMEKDDVIYIQTLAIPAEKDWYQSAVDAYDRFKKGDMPMKLRMNKQTIAKSGIKAAAYVTLGAINIVSELITGEEPKEKINLNEGERALILRDGKLTSATLQKVRGDAYDFSVRVGIVCSDPRRAKALMRMLTMAFRELDGDNHLIAHNVNVDRTWKRMKGRSMGLRLQSDYMSIPEVSRLFMLPTGPLQEKYHIENIKQLEVEIPKKFTDGGMYLGEHAMKGKSMPIYQPTDNDDISCLPNIVIGPMGCGKTKGFGANWIVQAVRNGYGALGIDAAKHEIGDEVEKALPPDKVKRINLANTVFGLDWAEVKYSPRSRGMLADAVMAFFEDNTDTAGAQTQRFLEAAVYGMQTGKLKEIMTIFRKKEYREKIIEQMPDTIHRETLEEFNEYKPDRQRQILAPIFNRLNVVLGDEWLMQCMDSDNSLDMVKLMSTPQAVIFDVAKVD
jgi:hypothetical protein